MELKLGDLQIKQGYSIGEVKMAVAQVGGSGTSNYEDLENLPRINGVELIGNKTTEDLGIVSKETDPTVPSYVKAITEQNIVNWNDKAEKADIPDVSEFITKSEVYNKEEVNSLISNINSFRTEIVSVLPSENINASTIYLIARTDSSGNDYYEEYLYVGDKFELIGTTKLDLSEYAKKSELPTKTSDLENNSGFITLADVPSVDLSNYYTKSETDALIGNVNTALESILGV